MWSMKDVVSDNVPPKNIEQEIVAVPEKKPIVKFTVETGENNPRKKPSFTKKDHTNTFLMYSVVHISTHPSKELCSKMDLEEVFVSLS